MLAAQVQTVTKRKPLSGPAMKTILESAGIKAPQVVRSRKTGEYTASIYVPGQQQAIAPAVVWTQKMMSAFEGVKVVNTGETRADWREGNPVIMVGVTFTAEQIKPKQQTGSSFAAPSRTGMFYRETCEPCRI